MRPHQNLDTVNRLMNKVNAVQAYSLGFLSGTAEEHHVILDDNVLRQIAQSNDLNDATGYYAVWLMKRTEANGGVFKRDW